MLHFHKHYPNTREVVLTLKALIIVTLLPEAVAAVPEAVVAALLLVGPPWHWYLSFSTQTQNVSAIFFNNIECITQ